MTVSEATGGDTDAHVSDPARASFIHTVPRIPRMEYHPVRTHAGFGVLRGQDSFPMPLVIETSLLGYWLARTGQSVSL
eukprot:7759623-Alexandrium_andersonii.AAC.1